MGGRLRTQLVPFKLELSKEEFSSLQSVSLWLGLSMAWVAAPESAEGSWRGRGLQTQLAPPKLKLSKEEVFSLQSVSLWLGLSVTWVAAAQC